MLCKFRTIFFAGGVFISFFLDSCKSDKINTIDSPCLSIVKKFFIGIETSDYINALDSLLLSNSNIDFNDSTTIKLRDGFKNINELSGNFLGFKLLKKRFIEDDIAIYSYLVKYKKKFYRFIFIFYKTGEEVNIYKFAYDDVLDLELEESLKLYVQ